MVRISCLKMGPAVWNEGSKEKFVEEGWTRGISTVLPRVHVSMPVGGEGAQACYPLVL